MEFTDEAPPRVYVTREDFENDVVRPALGDYAAEFDLDAITAELMEWHTETTAEGLILDNRTGWIARQNIDFWEVVQRHALDGTGQ